MQSKHTEYIKNTLKRKDILYYLTEQDRISTLFWALNSLKIIKDPYFEELKKESLTFVISCLREDGGFGPKPSYSSTIVSTLNAIQILYIIGIPYYNKKTVDFILKLQNKNGEFCFDEYGDVDTRFDCCAVVSLKLLSIMENYKTTDFSGCIGIPPEELFNCYVSFFKREDLDNPIDPIFLNKIGFNVESTLNHLFICHNLDGGFGQIRGSESHGAQVFCVVSSLKVLGYLDNIDQMKTIDFLVKRQLDNGGLNGRVNKKEDVCYSFWVFSSLLILESKQLIDNEMLTKFIYSCEGDDGGFSDRPGNMVDLYHMMFSLCSLSLMGNKSLGDIHPCFSL